MLKNIWNDEENSFLIEQGGGGIKKHRKNIFIWEFWYDININDEYFCG